MPDVVFHFEDGHTTTVSAVKGSNLLETARSANVVIDAPCSGNGSCGKCRVRSRAGTLHSKKSLHITEEEYAQGWRLACENTIVEDVEIEVPDVASAFKKKMKIADLGSAKETIIFEEAKEKIKTAGIPMENSMELLEISMDAPSLDDTMPDNERLIRAVKHTTGISRVRMTYTVLKKLPVTLRNSNFHVQCVAGKTDDDIFLYDVLPAKEDPVIGGLAIDIGTTSVAALLIDMTSGKILSKASTGNAQIRFGADVINRIIGSTKEGGQKQLQDAIIDDTLNPLILEMCQDADISPEHIYRICVAANTTMNHLFAGIYADYLRQEPYIPAFFKSNSIFASDLGLNVHPDAHIIFAPNVGSYVGGDITAGTLVSLLWDKPEFSLFIDLGTNGELVFGNNDFMMCCACSAGPAFEGGDISCGMRATDGAIEACTIDADTMEPHFHIVGGQDEKPVGICGSGIIDLISELFRTRIINPKGKFVREGKRILHDEHGMGSYILVYREEAAGNKDIQITEVDIDDFIRAKGAIFSAVRTMLHSIDFDVSMIDQVYVAGGIGSGINMKNAIRIGMFPDIEIERFHYIGNSSLTGAYTMLMSTEAERKTYGLAANMTYLELSIVPTYMDEFIASCFLPHTDASLFPNVK